MGIKDTLSKEGFTSKLKSIGRLRVPANHASIISISALILILFVAFTIRIMPIRWEIPTGTLRLSEFDPYYQYEITNHMVQNGLLSPYTENNGVGWINYQQWYPQGLNLRSSLPSLPLTTAILYNIISFLGVNIDVMAFASLMPVFLGTLAVLVMYFVGKDMGGKAVGLIAALALALAPSYIQRSSLGFFDTETVGILALLVFIYMFLRAIDGNRTLNSTLKYSIGAGLALAYFVAGWGAAYYLTGLGALFVFALIILKRHSRRLLLSYSVTFGLGLFFAINVPYLSTSYLTTAPILPLAGVFVLLCIAELMQHGLSARTKTILVIAALVAIVGGFVALSSLGYMTDIAGKFATVVDPFIRSANPLIESVAEHRISSWGSIYYELGIGVMFFLVGLYFTLKNPTNRNIFLTLFGITALYFAGSMVRLLILLAPAFALLAATGVVGIVKPFFGLLRQAPQALVKSKRSLARVSREYAGLAVFLVFLLLVSNFAFSPQTGGMPRVYSQAYTPITISAGGLPLSPNEPVQEWLNALSWTQSNLQSTTVVDAWWDYGYWLTMLGNVTSLADNATINATQIQNVGFTFMGNETQSLKMLKTYNAEYILVFTTVAPREVTSGQYTVTSVGYGDEGKWMWMAKISGQDRDRFVRDGFIDENSSWVDETKFGSYNNQSNVWEWNSIGQNTTIYKLMSWAKQQWATRNGLTADTSIAAPTYFNATQGYIAGLDLTLQDAFNKYGGLVPLVAIYKIDWDKYNADVAAGIIQ